MHIQTQQGHKMLNQIGLMSGRPTKSSTPFTDNLKAAFAPKPASTLEEQLAAMTPAALSSLVTQVKLLQKFYNPNTNLGYEYHVKSVYPKLGGPTQKLYADVLNEIAPLKSTPAKTETRNRSSEILGGVELQLELFNNARQQKPREAVLASPVHEANAPTNSSKTAATPTETVATQASATFKDKNDFITRLRPIADEVGAELGVNADIILAQAALESGFGKSFKGNNLMGIKSHGEEGGVNVITHEIVDGKKVKLTDNFKRYASPEDSIRGYGKFIKANSRYKHFMRAGAENLEAQLSALQSSGYATDTMYSSKLHNIIKGLQGKAVPT